jgi:hypothetical protein
LYSIFNPASFWDVEVTHEIVLGVEKPDGLARFVTEGMGFQVKEFPCRQVS